MHSQIKVLYVLEYYNWFGIIWELLFKIWVLEAKKTTTLVSLCFTTFTRRGEVEGFLSQERQRMEGVFRCRI